MAPETASRPHLPAAPPGGVFTVSLDFELYWGVRDQLALARYRRNLLGVPGAVAGMLRLFEARGVHATWATVGFLFFRDLEDLAGSLPALQPTYAREVLSPYPYVREGGPRTPPATSPPT